MPAPVDSPDKPQKPARWKIPLRPFLAQGRAARTAVWLWLAAGLLPASGGSAPASEAFHGPFASWINLQTEFGAKGDGQADDTAALQAGLEALPVHGKAKPGDRHVLYLPKGTYRITQPLVWENRMGVALIGEDPATAIIRYDGPEGGVMLTCRGVSYSQFGRITWDGAGRAKAAIAHQWNPETKVGPAVTYMEHADQVFQNVQRGLIGGCVVPSRNKNGEITHYNHGMDAEFMVKRCKFIRCAEAGLSIESFNALDWWVWDSEFVDCGVGATNGARKEYGGGHFHLYRCLFRGSKIADIRTGHTSYFGFRFNTSIGSRRFLETFRPEGFNMTPPLDPLLKPVPGWRDDDRNGSAQVLQGNRILHPTDATPVWVNQHGPLMLLDNTFVLPAGQGAPVVHVHPPTGGAQCISIGNTFYGPSETAVHGELIELDNRTSDPTLANTAPPALPPAAPRVARRVFELKAGADGAEIQAAIDQAVQLAGQKPVVHLPAGRYPVRQTLLIPPGADLQLTGDGINTVLIWEGADGGTMLQLAGPARATLRDFRIAGIWNSNGQKLGRGIVAENLDQPGSQILLDQANTQGCTSRGMVFDGLGQARVEAIGSGVAGTAGPGLVVNGTGETTPAWVALFGSAGSNNQQTHLVSQGGTLLVWDTWYETSPGTKDAEPRYIHLSDRGNFTFFNGLIATLPGKEARRDLYSIDLDGFRGRFSLIGTQLNTLNPQLRLAGDGAGLSALVLACNFGQADPWLENQSPTARLGVLASSRSLQPLPPVGKVEPEFLREMLQDARRIQPTGWHPAPSGATDLRMHRISVYAKVGDGMIFSSRASRPAKP